MKDGVAGHSSPGGWPLFFVGVRSNSPQRLVASCLAPRMYFTVPPRMAFVFSRAFPIKRSYRIGEVALELGVHVTTVRRWTDEGRLPCIRLGTQRRITLEALQGFVRQTRA